MLAEPINAIKEMATYAVSDFKYEAVPLTFKRKVDDIYISVSSKLQWGTESFLKSERSGTSSAQEFEYSIELDITTKFYCTPTAINTRIVESLAKLGDYTPPWWYNPHLGTVFSFGSDPQLQYFTELVSVQSTTIASTESSLSTSASSASLDSPIDSTPEKAPSPSLLASQAAAGRATIVECDSFNLDWFPRKPARDATAVLNLVIFFPGLGLSSKNVRPHPTYLSSSLSSSSLLALDQNFAQKFARHMFEEGGYYTVICGARGVDVPLRSNRSVATFLREYEYDLLFAFSLQILASEHD